MTKRIYNRATLFEFGSFLSSFDLNLLINFSYENSFFIAGYSGEKWVPLAKLNTHEKVLYFLQVEKENFID